MTETASLRARRRNIARALGSSDFFMRSLVIERQLGTSSEQSSTAVDATEEISHPPFEKDRP